MRTVIRVLAASLLSAVLLVATPASAETPPNDTPESAATLVAGVSFEFDTTTATHAGEIDGPAGCRTGRTVWFKIQAPQDGVLQIDLSGSEFTTVLNVYDTSVSPANLVNCETTPMGSSGLMRTAVTAGRTYLMQVGGSWDPRTENRGAAESGTFALQISMGSARPGEQFAAARPLGTEQVLNVNTDGLRNEPGEPQPSCVSRNGTSDRTVWYAYAAAASGTLRVAVDTFGREDSGPGNPVVAAYRGSSLPGLVQVACHDDRAEGDPGAVLMLPVTAGRTYFLQVGTWTAPDGAHEAGLVSVTPTFLDPQQPPGPPAPGTVSLEGSSRNAEGVGFVQEVDVESTVARVFLPVELRLPRDVRVASFGVFRGACEQTARRRLSCLLEDMAAQQGRRIGVLLVPLTAGPHVLSATSGDASSRTVARPATVCDVRGTRGRDVLRGTRRSETLCGLGGSDVLLGRGGDDLLLGGGGADRASYAGAPATVVNLARSGLRRVAAAPLEEGADGHGLDRFVDVEGAVGGRRGDLLLGSREADVLVGGGGPDRMAGRGGADVLKGGAALDLLRGGGGEDLLVGGRETDQLDGGSGVDRCRERTDLRLSCER